MNEQNPIMTDEEVSALLRCSVKTLRRRMNLAKPKAGEVDLHKAEPMKFGGRRFWLRSKVEKTLGIN